MRRVTLAVAFVALCVLAALLGGRAHAATASVHVEWRRGTTVYGAQSLNSTGSSAASSPAPNFDDTGVAGGSVRITPTAGAAIVVVGAATPTATQVNGTYVVVGGAPIELPALPGQEVAIVPATDQPSPGDVNVILYGADPTDATSSATAFQNAVTAAGGNCVFAPVGRYHFHGVTSSTPICIRGAGRGSGPGPGAQSNANVTQLLNDSSTADMFTVTSIYPSTFRHFQINVEPAARPATAGCGIDLIGAGTGNVANPEIEDVGFTNPFTPICILRPYAPKIDHDYFDSWGGNAIRLTTSAGVEGGGGFVNNNLFYGVDTTTTAPLYSEVGYLYVDTNVFDGGPEAVQINLKNFNAGRISITNNSIENYLTYGVTVATQDGSTLAELSVDNNEFSVFGQPTGGPETSAVYVAPYVGTPEWVTLCNITNNVDNSVSAANGIHIDVEAANVCTIAHNRIAEDGAASGVVGIKLAGASSVVAPVTVFDNLFSGAIATRYSLTSAVTLRDQAGLTVANLPSPVADGSQIFATDGAVGSSPCKGAGAGAMAFRINGAWSCTLSPWAPPKISNNWYAPDLTQIGPGVAVAASTIYFAPFFVLQPITVQALGVHVNTTSAGGNVQLAIYASNSATGRPTGSALCSTASLSVASAVAVSGTAACGLLLPGVMYWSAANDDNSTATFAGINVNGTRTSWLFGSATLANVANATNGDGPNGVSTPQTFGTWPSVTSATFTEVETLIPPVVFMQAQ